MAKYNVGKLTSTDEMVRLYQKQVKDTGGKLPEQASKYEQVASFMTPAYQTFSFDLVTRLLPPSFAGSVLDVGCGLGCLYPHLVAEGATGVYLGVDLVPELVEIAQSRIEHETMLSEFRVGDFLSKEVQAELRQFDPDVVIMTSIFGLVPDSGFMLECLLAARDLSPKMVIMTANSNEGWRTKPKSHRYDPGEVLKLGLRLSPEVTFMRKKDQDYSCFGMRLVF